MKISGIHKFLYTLFAGVLVAVIVGFGLMWLQANRERAVFVNNETKLDSNLDQARKKLEIEEGYLEQLQRDPEFFEWVARQRIGYAHSDEIIFRFDEKGAKMLDLNNIAK